MGALTCKIGDQTANVNDLVISFFPSVFDTLWAALHDGRGFCLNVRDRELHYWLKSVQSFCNNHKVQYRLKCKYRMFNKMLTLHISKWIKLRKGLQYWTLVCSCVSGRHESQRSCLWGFLSFGAHGSFLPRSPIAGSFDPKRIKWWCQISGILGESGVHYQTVRLCVSAANGVPQRVGKSSLLDMNTWWGQDGGLTSLWLYRPPLSVTHMRLFVPAAPRRGSPPLACLRRCVSSAFAAMEGASALAHWAPSVCVSYVWVLMECKLEQVRYEAGYLGQLTFMFWSV